MDTALELQPSVVPQNQYSRPRIVIAGNPNCGKTSLFNALTGSRYKVANYSGVTVEHREGALALEDFSKTELIDLPGIYNLSTTAEDERIATRAILGSLAVDSAPDLILSVVDASNLERNLYLTSQLIDLGIPVVVALNMTDIADKKGISIMPELLSRELGVEVVSIVATKQAGLNELKRILNKTLLTRTVSNKRFGWLKGTTEYQEAAKRVGQKELGAEVYTSKVDPVQLGSILLSRSVRSDNEDIEQIIQSETQDLQANDLDPLSLEPSARYSWIDSVVTKCCSRPKGDKSYLSEKISAITTHKVWGLVVFALIMATIFQSIFLWASYPMDFIDEQFAVLGEWLSATLPAGQLRSLLVDGIVAGVGSVVIFVPQIAILFFFLGLLEDSGYLARAAHLMDKVMRKFGLQGRSFVPLLSSFACAIPGIMATRTIPSFADRIATIMVAPLMSCSARLPVYTVLIAAFIPEQSVFGFLSLQGLVLLSLYLLGILGAVLVAQLLRLSVLKGKPALFVMEMPDFRFPVLRVVVRAVYDRVIVFLKNAGTIILACSIVLWFLASYPHGSVEESYAGRIGKTMEPVIEPLGYNWELGVGILASFAAREVFVSSLATVYNLGEDDSEGQTLINSLKERRTAGAFSLATALSLLVFYVFACQCMATLAVCKRETGSWGWTGLMLLYMTTLAYFGAWATFNLASYMGAG